MTPLSDLPPGVQRVLVGALELLSVLRERPEFLPEPVLHAAAEFEAIVGEHVGVVDR